jgi:hypothetical protein
MKFNASQNAAPVLGYVGALSWTAVELLRAKPLVVGGYEGFGPEPSVDHIPWQAKLPSHRGYNCSAFDGSVC